MSALFNVVQPLDLDIVGGRGGFVYTADPFRQYLDWYNDNGVVSLGYSHELSSEHVSHLPQMFKSLFREYVADQLCGWSDMDAVYFAMSGTDAVETAIKGARLYQRKAGAHPSKNRILSLAGQYHGRTGFALAASRSADYHKVGFGPMPYGFGVLRDDFTIDWSQPGEDASIGDCHDEAGPEHVAAIIYAPVLMNNNVRPYSHDFHMKLAGWADKHDILIIHDDIQGGGGRCGRVATWQRDDVGYQPDILCLGKGIGAGEPLSATLATREVASAFTPGTHFYTAGGASLRSLQGCLDLLSYLAGDVGGPERLGAYVVDGLKGHPLVDQIWNVGAMIALMPKWDEDRFTAFDIFAKAREHGLILVNFRPNNELKIVPRLNSTKAELDFGIEALRRTMDEFVR
jgi:acetylornithine/N-succinyldiaminopimelate aminotransferase